MPQEKPSAKSLDSDLVPLTLRIPRPIHARLKEISEAEYRSLNHQIIMALSLFVDTHAAAPRARAKTVRASERT